MTTSSFILVCVIGFGLAHAIYVLRDLILDVRVWILRTWSPRGLTTADRGEPMVTSPSLQILCARSFASLVDHMMIDA